ncbi:uncharacterized protein AC631_04562 [Debaryomyces fabryi]|uniref:Glycoside hydrolase family 17 protein n=1 Tax=Debaryomyces fabryi TaxID=58627 RepID=A0A0V1PTU6_9ASCO|nr:uncharacterized protein AC631_04562 [Debaryomyces fabryi]KRZ99686.1 hypothetical protein AC631_04562 [Debaryomyces fabryi]CUM45868.1 unnamed protein product [Debaryomyces fabryi]
MISSTYFLSFFLLIQVIFGAPVAKLITRVHTADAVTKMNTYTTGTTTVNLPPVEIFISNGVTYTFTLNNEAAAAPTTMTSIYTDDSDNNNNNNNDDDENNNSTPAQTPAATTSPSTNNGENGSPTAANSPNDYTPAATGNTQDNTPTSTSSPQGNAPSSTNSPDDTKPSSTNGAQTTTSQQNTISSSTTDEETTSSTESTTSSSDSTSSASSGSISAPSAIAYSPYTDDGGCKDTSTIESDLELISSKGINKIRVYGTDCGLYDTIIPKAKDLDMKINQGFWISDAGVDSIDDSVSEFIEWGSNNGYDVIDFITVGNEAINSNFCSVSDLISKIKSVKSKLQDAGYNGKVTTSEPPAIFVDNPSLCKNSNIDFVGINPHSYFNTVIGANLAGWYVTSEQSLVSKACDMDVVITETGYPSKGSSNGDNYPSAENQEIAIKSIIEKTNGQVTILSTYNDMWKHPGPHDIEQYFGAIDLFS